MGGLEKWECSIQLATVEGSSSYFSNLFRVKSRQEGKLTVTPLEFQFFVVFFFWLCLVLSFYTVTFARTTKELQLAVLMMSTTTMTGPRYCPTSLSSAS